MMGALFRVVLVAISTANALHYIPQKLHGCTRCMKYRRADLLRHRMRPDSSQEQGDTTLSTAPQGTRLRELLDESEDDEWDPFCVKACSWKQNAHRY